MSKNKEWNSQQATPSCVDMNDTKGYQVRDGLGGTIKVSDHDSITCLWPLWEEESALSEMREKCTECDAERGECTE